MFISKFDLVTPTGKGNCQKKQVANAYLQSQWQRLVDTTISKRVLQVGRYTQNISRKDRPDIRIVLSRMRTAL